MIYSPRLDFDGSDSCGNKFIDSYLENDCLLTTGELDRLTSGSIVERRLGAVKTYVSENLHNAIVFSLAWINPLWFILFGTFMNLAAFTVFEYYCPSVKEQPPLWSYKLAAFAAASFLFGKLAAYESESWENDVNAYILELVAHMGEAISQVALTMSVCCCLQLGDQPFLPLYMCFLSTASYYASHWYAYCSGWLDFCLFGITEIETLALSIVSFTITCLFGTEIWYKEIYGYETRMIIPMVYSLFVGSHIIAYTVMVFDGGIGRNGSTMAGTSVISPMFSYLAALMPFFLMLKRYPSLADNTCILMAMFGCIFSKVTIRVIIGHMSRSEIMIWDYIFFAPAMLMLNQYYDHRIKDEFLLHYAALYSIFSLLIYCITIIRQVWYFRPNSGLGYVQ